ncbi:unnamed protein product [Schistocephalus solidus]|uniref:Reverse transcriptase domain-containing protein n=1 Tax=Schistocephalus solidus TaxID=70667 RepID=A0A183TEL3_SCHSO|nr:unnamed protein product [Schistocephalus solidus]
MVNWDNPCWRGDGSAGPHGLAGFNGNGLLLLRICAELRLILSNTFFCLSMRLKATWVYPRSRHRHHLNYVLARRPDQQDMLVTKVTPETIDLIFDARQLHEKCQEIQTDLYSTFVDLTKAFHTVNRDGLWKVMQKFGCPERFTHMVRQLHDGMTARVTDNGAVSEAFAVINGVKQGYVLAPTLFSILFSAMLMDAYRDEHPGIRIAYRTDGHLLSSRHMQTTTRVSKTTVHNLLFADNCALKTVTEEDLQRSMYRFAAGCANFGLTISTAKTVMHQPPPCTEYNAPRINVNGAQLKNVETFAYLGSMLSRNTRIDDEVAQRISKASQAYGRLQASVWNRAVFE